MSLLDSFRIAHLLVSKPMKSRVANDNAPLWPGHLVTDPAALLLDEPLTALDHATKRDDSRRPARLECKVTGYRIAVRDALSARGIRAR